MNSCRRVWRTKSVLSNSRLPVGPADGYHPDRSAIQANVRPAQQRGDEVLGHLVGIGDAISLSRQPGFRRQLGVGFRLVGSRGSTVAAVYLGRLSIGARNSVRASCPRSALRHSHRGPRSQSGAVHQSVGPRFSYQATVLSREDAVKMSRSPSPSRSAATASIGPSAVVVMTFAPENRPRSRFSVPNDPIIILGNDDNVRITVGIEVCRSYRRDIVEAGCDSAPAAEITTTPVFVPRHRIIPI